MEQHFPVEHAAARPVPPGDLRVLVVDDNPVNQQVALGMLKWLGLPADTAADGRAALAALAAQRYDVVLMDIQMPVMDGLEATRAIRAGEAGVRDPAVPVIALTAHALQDDRERCLRAGMNGHVSKPVTRAALVPALKAWLPALPLDDAGPAEEPAGPPELDAPSFLQRMMGDVALARVVAQAFVEDAPVQLDALRQRLDAGDARGAEHCAHGLKGASAAVGGERLRALAHRAEMAARAGDLDTVRGSLDGLRDRLDRLSRALKESTFVDGAPERGHEDADC